jgi:hypothetical protein
MKADSVVAELVGDRPRRLFATRSPGPGVAGALLPQGFGGSCQGNRRRPSGPTPWRAGLAPGRVAAEPGYRGVWIYLWITPDRFDVRRRAVAGPCRRPHVPHLRSPRMARYPSVTAAPSGRAVAASGTLSPCLLLDRPRGSGTKALEATLHCGCRSSLIFQAGVAVDVGGGVRPRRSHSGWLAGTPTTQ